MSKGSTRVGHPSTIANIVRILIVLSVAGGLILQFAPARSGLTALIFFTIQSNIILGAYYAWALIKQNSWDTRRSNIARGAATLFIAITGTVYHVILAPGVGFSMGEGADWVGYTSNLLVHTVTPALAAIDWISFGRARKDVPWRAALYWLSYPLAYSIFAFVRGAFTDHYPYPFLDLTKNTVLEVTVNCIVLGIGFYLLGLIVIAIGKGMSKITAR